MTLYKNSAKDYIYIYLVVQAARLYSPPLGSC